MLEGRRFFLVPHRALPDLQRMKLLLFCGRLVGPGEFRVRGERRGECAGWRRQGRFRPYFGRREGRPGRPAGWRQGGVRYRPDAARNRRKICG
jgi:hypothetical protein